MALPSKRVPLDMTVMQKNLALHDAFLHILLAHPEPFGSGLDGVELALLPDDDPDLAMINAKIGKSLKEEGHWVVCVEISRKKQSARILNNEEQEDVLKRA